MERNKAICHHRCTRMNTEYKTLIQAEALVHNVPGLRGLFISVHRRTPAATRLQARKEGRLCLRLVAVSLMLAGGFALFQSACGHFFSHDLRYLRMDMVQLCGLRQGRVVRFMFHDRVSFGGALIAIGWLYLWLERFPLKAGETWAWRTFLLSGLTGFGSFFGCLGYGYLDS